MRKLFIYDGGVRHSKKWRIHMKVRTRELWFYSAFGLTLLRNFVTNSIFFEISNKILLIIIILSKALLLNVLRLEYQHLL